jgi:fatty-acyl-CoA synthase
MTPDIGLANWLAQRAARTPERKALTFEGATWTYAQLQQRIEALSGQLRSLGVERGARVAFLGLNQPAFLVAMFASARLGAIYVPLNFRLTGPELVANVTDSTVHTLIADAQHRAIVDGIRGEMPSVQRYLSEGEAAGWLPIATPADEAAPAVRVDADDVALIMYTSGTTGRAKGAMLTHGNLWWNNTNAMHELDVMQGDVSLCAAPLFHIGGLNVFTLVTLQKGGEVVLTRAFDPGGALAEIAARRVTTMFGVPAMFQFMAQHPSFAATDLSSLRTLVCGGAPCPKPLLEIYEARGVPIQQGYGLTETAPMVSFLAPEYALSKIGSSGRPPLFTEIKLVGFDGRPVTQPGVNGEVHTRGPNVMKGYWGRPEASAEVIDADGWFRTGDVAYWDADGCIYICDRVKDMIISGGENIYPAEVESVISKHPAVAEAAVIGVPDEKWGETTLAVVALKAGQSLGIEELREFAATQLSRYKLPRRLEVVAALPRNATGKLVKTELRKQFK